MGNTHIFQPQDSTCLATSANLKPGVAVQGGYFNLITESSLSKIYRYLTEYVVTITYEQFVLFDRYDDVEVARWPASYPGIALATESNLGAIVNPGRDFNRNITLALLGASTPALRAGLGDNSTLPVALRAGSYICEAAKNTRLDSAYLPGTVTVGASARLTTRLAASTLADRAVFST